MRGNRQKSDGAASLLHSEPHAVVVLQVLEAACSPCRPPQPVSARACPGTTTTRADVHGSRNSPSHHTYTHARLVRQESVTKHCCARQVDVPLERPAVKTSSSMRGRTDGEGERAARAGGVSPSLRSVCWVRRSVGLSVGRAGLSACQYAVPSYTHSLHFSSVAARLPWPPDELNG